MSLPAFRVAEIGQSIWYDNLSRDLLDDGGVQRLVEEHGVRGMTSNPSIFQKAMSTSAAYAAQYAELAAAGKSVPEIYEAMAVADIQRACDALRPIYDASGGRDGFVSLEVSPALAHETDATVAEAQRLFAAVDRPNTMIKVPATPAGIPAVRALIGAGLNINITLIFALDAYRAVVDAYLAGLEDRLARGEAIDKINSVASFFVSRVDGAVDKALDAVAAERPDDAERATALRGKAAIANAKQAYEIFETEFGSPRFEPLRAAGAAVQRPLWASTSTKDPSYPDTLYVDTLIGPHTVNTLPPKTLDAFNDHGTVAETVRDGLAEAKASIAGIEALGISMDDVCAQLLDAGVASFAKSFDELLEAVAERGRGAAAEADRPFGSPATPTS